MSFFSSNVLLKGKHLDVVEAHLIFFAKRRTCIAAFVMEFEKGIALGKLIKSVAILILLNA